MNKNKPLVYVSFPKTGLGNMLMVWARGLVFARLNGFNLATSPWWGFRWGALLRREQKKRLYWKYFTETPFYIQLPARFQWGFKNIMIEPPVEKLTGTSLHNKTLFLFKQVMPDYDLFGSIKNYHGMIATELMNALHPSRKSMLLTFEPPVIGIHIRRGDFKLGSTLTPIDFFIDGINIIRQQVGECLPVTVFTDADMDELGKLFLLPSIKRAEKKADILDILLMSKSRFLLLSAGSTFSYWAAFLSDAFVIRPASDWLHQIRDVTPGKDFFDLKWQHDEEGTQNALKENLTRYFLKLHS